MERITGKPAGAGRSTRGAIASRASALALVILTLFAVPRLAAQQAADSSDASQPPLGGFLNPDGTLRLDRSFSGSIDPRGWRLRTGNDGAPRFEPLAMAADSSTDSLIDTPGSISGDEGWDDRFGPQGPNGTVSAIAMLGDEVYIGGKFTVVGGLRANNLAAWNRRTRRWSTVGGGVGGQIRAMTVANNALYVGGIFSAAGGIEAKGVARWDPATSTWSAFGGGVQLVAGAVARGGDVYAIAVHGENVYIGGFFNAADDPSTANLAMWNGTKWGPVDRARLPNTGFIYALMVRGDDLFIGGGFTKMGKIDLPYIAQWNIATRTWAPLGSGMNAPVRAILASGTDIYVGGVFTAAGGHPAARIARWDGASWYPLGTGVDGTVYALAAEGSDLYVGGAFTTVSGMVANCVAKWNGGSWSMMEIGMGLTPNAASQWNITAPTFDVMSAYEETSTDAPYVWALGAIEGEVFAGGHFSSAGNFTVHHLAMWSDVHWRDVGTSNQNAINYNGADGAVYAIAIRGDDVYIGGDFTTVGGAAVRRIARWNWATSQWSGLGGGIDGAASRVRAMVLVGGDLYVGGVFDSAGGVPARGVARWNGTSWSAVGGGVGGDNPYVFALATVGGDLYAGGSFASAGGVPARGIARFAIGASSWSALDSGVANETNSAYVTAIAARGGDLIVGGGFTRAGEVRANNIALWTGAAWKTLGDGAFNGADGPVRAIAVDGGGTVYAGGEFRAAGGTAGPYLARWNGSAWAAMPKSPNGAVHGIAILPTGFYIGGEFTAVGTARAGHLARWNGAAWATSGVVDSINGFVHAIVAASSGSVYVGGEFSTINSVDARNIARIDSAVVSSLGADPRSGVYNIITAVTIHGTDVYVGGAFGAIGGFHIGGLARWDGQRWFPVAPELNGIVRAIAVDDAGGVYVGGEFTRAGTVSADGLAYWNGTLWSRLGTGLGGARPWVYALRIAGGSLYAGGGFSTAGGYRSNHIARWDIGAGAWYPMGGGVSGASHATYVAAIAAIGRDIYVGGVFPTAGTVKSENIARWDGTSWNSVGGGVNNSVYTLAVDRNARLLVGGDFRATADQSFKYMVSWDGTSLTPFPGIFRGPVTMIAVSDFDVFVAGRFNYVSDVQTVGLARFDGTAWRNVGHGPSLDFKPGFIYAMDASGKDLYVGGNFSTAGVRPSFNFAHWSRTDVASVEMPAPARAAGGLVMPSAVPNPISVRAAIGFTLRERADATIAIFNTRGEAVATLASGTFEAGDHVLHWEPGDLPDGVYYCRLASNGAIATTKMILTGGGTR